MVFAMLSYITTNTNLTPLNRNYEEVPVESHLSNSAYSHFKRDRDSFQAYVSSVEQEAA
jgi:hypothetical protein